MIHATAAPAIPEMPELVFKVSSLLTGFAPHIQYRTDHRPQVEHLESWNTLLADNRLTRYTAEQRHRVIERFSEFCVGHVEFDDQGRYWDSRQLDTVAHEIISDPENTGQPRGVLLIGFMHGWENNARFDNGNLNSFRAVLYDLYLTEAKLYPDPNRQRRIMGIYLSWRGKSHRIPVIKRLTYWDRKRTAHKVGRGDLVETLSRIEQIRFHTPLADRQSRLIIVGHSFGGAAVYSAVAPYIRTVAAGEDQAADLENHGRIAKIRGIGDLVVLVNPAFEALLYDAVDRLTHSIEAYDADQHVILMTVGADNDQATRLPFWAGQWLARFFQWSRGPEFRMITTSVSNWNRFITHELRPAQPGAPVEQVCKNSKLQIAPWKQSRETPATAAHRHPPRNWKSFIPDNRSWEIEEIRQPPMPVNHAFMTVRTVNKVIDGHNGIFQTVFVEFLRDFVIAQDQSAAASTGPPPSTVTLAADPASGVQKKVRSL